MTNEETQAVRKALAPQPMPLSETLMLAMFYAIGILSTLYLTVELIKWVVGA